VLEQAALADGADHGPPVVGGDHGKLGDAVLVQERHRVAHPLVRADDDERRDLAPVVLAAQDVAHGEVGRALEEAVLGHPGVREDLAQVGAPAVGQDHRHHRLGVVELARDLQGRVERGAARAAGQDALGHRQAPGGQERVLVRDADPAVDHGGIERRRPEVLANPLHQVRPDGVGPPE
jgi:hypothetical protein